MNNSHQCRLQAWALFISLAMSAGTAGATESFINTFPNWDPSSPDRTYTADFGLPSNGGIPTWGQTFTAPADARQLILFAISLEIITPNNPDLTLTGSLMQWNGQRPIGPELYHGDPIVPPSQHGAAIFFPKGDVAEVDVTPGQQYVFILNAVDPMDGIDRRARLPIADFSGSSPQFRPFDSYTGGGIVYQSPGADPTADWVSLGTSDTVFLAEFSSSPDPANASLLAISAAFLALAGLRRKYAGRSLKQV